MKNNQQSKKPWGKFFQNYLLAMGIIALLGSASGIVVFYFATLVGVNTIFQAFQEQPHNFKLLILMSFGSICLLSLFIMGMILLSWMHKITDKKLLVRRYDVVIAVFAIIGIIFVFVPPYGFIFMILNVYIIFRTIHYVRIKNIYDEEKVKYEQEQQNKHKDDCEIKNW